MAHLNYKHLKYFWMVAKSGSIAKAGEQLFLSPQSISGQLGEFENALGVQLFNRVGRRLVLTEMGHQIYRYAEEIFALGKELMDVVQSTDSHHTQIFRVGILSSVPKTVAYSVMSSAFQADNPIRLVCREGKLSELLAEMAVHRLDMVIADKPMPSHLNIRAYNHLLGESAISILGSAQLIDNLPEGTFPHILHHAPFLMPSEDFAIHASLMQWFQTHHVAPQIAGIFDDSALLKMFGQGGAGFFVAPAAMKTYVQERYQVREIGVIESIKEQLFAITAERQLKHPAVVAIAEATRKVFPQR
jgi:LysR family transcriptional activator of nhaA